MAHVRHEQQFGVRNELRRALATARCDECVVEAMDDKRWYREVGELSPFRNCNEMSRPIRYISFHFRSAGGRS